MIVASESVYTATTAPWHARISWSAVFAGCVIALSIHLLLTMLGLSIGVAMVNPDANQTELPEISMAAGAAWTISALIALWIGGWAAGRTGRRGPGAIGSIHGLLVWSLATVVMFLFLSGGTGLLIGGALKAVGKGMTSAATVAATSAAQNNGPQRATSIVDSFLEEAVGTDANRNPNVNPARLRREVGAALIQNFREKSPDNRAALVNALVNAGGRSQQDAEALVSQWEDSYNRSVQTAKDAASRAAKKLAAVAAWTFVAFVLGALAAAWGGRVGGRRSERLEMEGTVAAAA